MKSEPEEHQGAGPSDVIPPSNIPQHQVQASEEAARVTCDDDAPTTHCDEDFMVLVLTENELPDQGDLCQEAEQSSAKLSNEHLANSHQGPRLGEVTGLPRVSLPEQTGFAQQIRTEGVPETSGQENASVGKPADTQGHGEIKTVDICSLSAEAEASFSQPVQAESQPELPIKGYYRYGCFAGTGQCDFRTICSTQLMNHLQTGHPSDSQYLCVYCGSQATSPAEHPP